MILRVLDIEVTPTVIELANEFCNWDADQQACFFSKIGSVSQSWLPHQLEAMNYSSNLTKDGRWALEKIAEYFGKSE